MMDNGGDNRWGNSYGITDEIMGDEMMHDLVSYIRLVLFLFSAWFAGYLHHILKKFDSFFCGTNLIKKWIKILEYPYSESLGINAVAQNHLAIP